MLIWVFFLCRIHICDEHSSKSCDFCGKCKKKEKKEKLLVLVISVNFLRFSMKTLEQNIRKSHTICLLDGKEDNKAKLEIFKFLRISALSQGYSL